MLKSTLAAVAAVFALSALSPAALAAKGDPHAGFQRDTLWRGDVYTSLTCLSIFNDRQGSSKQIANR